MNRSSLREFIRSKTQALPTMTTVELIVSAVNLSTGKPEDRIIATGTGSFQGFNGVPEAARPTDIGETYIRPRGRVNVFDDMVDGDDAPVGNLGDLYEANEYRVRVDSEVYSLAYKPQRLSPASPMWRLTVGDKL